MSPCHDYKTFSHAPTTIFLKPIRDRSQSYIIDPALGDNDAEELPTPSSTLANERPLTTGQLLAPSKPQRTPRASTVEFLVGKDFISAYHLSAEVSLPMNIDWRLLVFQWEINVSRRLTGIPGNFPLGALKINIDLIA